MANMAATVFGDHVQADKTWAGACSQRSRLVDALGLGLDGGPAALWRDPLVAQRVRACGNAAYA